MSPSPSYHGRFVWYDLVTTDSPGAQAFYARVAGWGTAPWGPPEQPYLMWTVKDSPIGGIGALSPEEQAKGIPPYWMGHIGTTDLDATVAQVPTLGGKILLPPTPIPTVGRFAIVQDPYGAVFSAFQAEGEAPGHEGPAAIGEISWVELATKDLDGALAFYGSLFGWTLGTDMDMGPNGIYRIFNRNGQMMGGMYGISEAMPMPPSWLYYIRVADIEAAAGDVSAAGGTIVQPIMDIPGGKIFMATDPQGAMFAAHWDPN
ncbi:MAG TPA: VOC family protein [Gemmatimonadaceae bacterium]|nr:VOC family protein [Gemmatimonadaceae bacterium]